MATPLSNASTVASQFQQALDIATLIEAVFTQLGPLAIQAFQAATTSDQATLDALHTQALAAAEALKPAGAAGDLTPAPLA